MSEKVVSIGHYAAIVAATLAAKSSTKARSGQGESDEVDPVTEHSNVRFFGKVLDQQSFDPLSPDRVPLVTVPRHPGGAEDTKDE